jgi:hypothetical protein
MAVNKPEPQRLVEDEGIFYFARDRRRTEIHAEKNQDIEVENDETHAVGNRTETVSKDETITIGAAADEGPSTTPTFRGDDNGEIPFDSLRFQKLSGDWDGDARDTVGFLGGDADGDGDTDGADFL